MDNKEVIYKPNSRVKTGLISSWILMFKSTLQARDLIWQLFKRDFLMMYRKSFIGIGWIVLSPIIGVLSWVLLNATGILQPGEVNVDSYAGYVLIGSSLWGLFIGFYSSALSTLNAGDGFIMQVKYPHEALLVKQIAQHLSNFIISFTLNMIIVIALGITPDWKIVLFPFLILPLLFLGSALGLVLSVFNIVAKDITQITGTILGFVFYATPIVYSDTIDNKALIKINEYNPLTYMIPPVRDIILTGMTDNLELFLISGLTSFALFLLALRLFYVSEDKAIERMV